VVLEDLEEEALEEEELQEDGKMIFKKKKKTGEVNLKCPRCNIVMKKIKKADVVIDVCESCNGMWLDDNEIEKLVKIGGKKKNGKEKK